MEAGSCILYSDFLVLVLSSGLLNPGFARHHRICQGGGDAAPEGAGRGSFPLAANHGSSHRFGGREFRFGSAEVGHAHTGGIVDIPLPRPIHDALLAEGLVEEHRWVPDSGWITLRIRGEEDLRQAVWLLRLSYLRYLLKTVADPRQVLERESEELRLNPPSGPC